MNITEIKVYCEKMYLEFFDNILTVRDFGKVHGMSEEKIFKILKIGSKVKRRRS